MAAVDLKAPRAHVNMQRPIPKVGVRLEIVVFDFKGVAPAFSKTCNKHRPADQLTKKMHP